VAHRQAQDAANVTINGELAALKRVFALAVQAGKLHAEPHLPMLQEDDERRAFLSRRSSTPSERTCRCRFGPL